MPTVILLHRRMLGLAMCILATEGLLGCRGLDENQLPPGTQDPSYYNNATGALGMRNAAVFAFGTELPNYIVVTGLLTDELANSSTFTATAGTGFENGSTVVDPIDERILPELSYGSVSSSGYASDVTYNGLQGARTALLQAIGQLANYTSSPKDTMILPPSASNALRGELYALYGYTEIMLADLFCSGIPLSTLNFQHDFTYRAGDSTAQIYRDAIAHLDTALALAGDSTKIQYLARIGLGRAYLDLAYTNPIYVKAAADDVSTTYVPDGYQYQLSELWKTTSGGINYITQYGVVSNREGGNGLPYLSSSDPRTADSTIFIPIGSVGDSVAVGFPQVYLAGIGGNYAAITVASSVEARLIEAEAALQPGGAGVSTWLGKLNQLRENAPALGTTPSLPAPLPDLTDPGIGSSNPDSARIALTFQERAFWLYMTGHRQGDLRRQLRQYHQYWLDQSKLYPTGQYLGLGAGLYGTDVTAPIPAAEFVNPLFKGCFNRAP